MYKFCKSPKKYFCIKTYDLCNGHSSKIGSRSDQPPIYLFWGQRTCGYCVVPDYSCKIPENQNFEYFYYEIDGIISSRIHVSESAPRLSKLNQLECTTGFGLYPEFTQTDLTCNDDVWVSIHFYCLPIIII